MSHHCMQIVHPARVVKTDPDSRWGDRIKSKREPSAWSDDMMMDIGTSIVNLRDQYMLER